MASRVLSACGGSYSTSLNNPFQVRHPGSKNTRLLWRSSIARRTTIRKVDAIVRVEARRLRAKLSDYYGGPGARDPIRIEIPTGSYVPLIRPVPAESNTPAIAAFSSSGVCLTWTVACFAMHTRFWQIRKGQGRWVANPISNTRSRLVLHTRHTNRPVLLS